MKNRKEHYNKKGMYAGYDKNHKEREALDYYSTPTEEVENILETLNLDLKGKNILEPCAGGGHMALGIMNHIKKNNICGAGLICTDIQKRDNLVYSDIWSGERFDFLSDEYPCNEGVIDYIIMNPPYSVIEPFTMKALGIANKGVLMLARLQFLEGEKRYEKILKDYPPTDVYVYVDRVACFKNGNVKEKMASAQAYAWFYWNIEKIDNENNETKIHWIRRNDKK